MVWTSRTRLRGHLHVVLLRIEVPWQQKGCCRPEIEQLALHLAEVYELLHLHITLQFVMHCVNQIGSVGESSQCYVSILGVCHACELQFTVSTVNVLHFSREVDGSLVALVPIEHIISQDLLTVTFLFVVLCSNEHWLKTPCPL